MPLHLRTISGRFQAARTQLSPCDRDHMARKTKHIYCLTLWKGLPTPGLDSFFVFCFKDTLRVDHVHLWLVRIIVVAISDNVGHRVLEYAREVVEVILREIKRWCS